jgi:hypothetical protein
MDPYRRWRVAVYVVSTVGALAVSMVLTLALLFAVVAWLTAVAVAS